jgi:quercetin dioxygenase-like cupin family protein
MQEPAGPRRSVIAGAAVAAVALLVSVLPAGGTPSSGVVSALLGRGTNSDRVRVTTRDVKLVTTGPTDVVTQTLTFAPGGTSGWHGHPGAVLVVVKSGTFTRYDARCNARVYTAGQAFVEGPEVAMVRNTGPGPAESIVTYLVPAGGPLRTDAPSPCPDL